MFKTSRNLKYAAYSIDDLSAILTLILKVNKVKTLIF